MELIVLAAGALIGFGLLVVLRAIYRRPLPLDRLVAAARPLPLRLSTVADANSPFDAAAGRLGTVVDPVVSAVGFQLSRSVLRDLRTVGRTPEAHLGMKLAGAAAGVMAAMAVIAIRPSGGPASVLGASLLGAAGGFLLPDAHLARLARRGREEFREAHSLFLLLAAGVVAGGGGVESALNLAAHAGKGWAPERLQYALDAARAQRRSPWEGLADLGDELGVAELEKLAATVALAGSEGAKVRESLLAQAKAVRSQLRHAAERDADSRTERMSFPLVGIAFAFLGFLVYAALQQITAPR